MKSMFMFCLVVFMFVSVNVLAQSDNSNLRSTFQQMNDKWGEAMVAGDVNTMINFYADDAVSMPANEPILKGKDAILTSNKKDFQDGQKFLNFKGSTTDVYSSGDIAVEQGTFNITLIPPKMTQQVTDQGKYVNIWQKQSDGSWKIKTEIWNSDTNPMSKMQAGAKEKNTEHMDMDKDKK